MRAICRALLTARRIGRGFPALAAHLPRGEAIRSLTEDVNRAANPESRQRLAAALAAVITRTRPDEVVEIPADAVLSLAAAYVREYGGDARFVLDSGLTRLAEDWPALKPSDVSSVVQYLSAALKAEKDTERRGQLAWLLALFAERLGKEESARICLAANESLMSDDFPPEDVDDWYRGLIALVIRLPATTATQTVCRIATGPRPSLIFFLDDLDAGDAARLARSVRGGLRRGNRRGSAFVAGNGPVQAGREAGTE